MRFFAESQLSPDFTNNLRSVLATLRSVTNLFAPLFLLTTAAKIYLLITNFPLFLMAYLRFGKDAFSL